MINIIKYSTLFIILAVAFYSDIKGRIISNKLNLIALILGIVIWIIQGADLYYFISLLLSFTALLLISFITNGGIGGGDIKLLSVIGLYIGILDWLILFILALVSALIFIGTVYVTKNKLIKNIVFAPYILIGYVGILLLNYIGIGGLL